MRHGEVRLELGDYLEGDLPMARRALVDAHLDGCHECAAHLRELRSTVDALRALSDPEPPPGLADAVLARIAAGEGRPGRVARLLARIPWHVRTRLTTPALALASALLLFLWLRPAGDMPGTVVTSRLAPEAARSSEPLDRGRPIGGSADLGEGPAPEEALAGPAVPAEELAEALHDPAIALQRTERLDTRARDAWVEALVNHAGDPEKLHALAQSLRALPGPRAAELAGAIERLAGAASPRR